MREIKFRAWMVNSKTMLKDVGFDNSSGQEHGVIELMQYTGLKDKNGVEIFEGDIIRTVDDFGREEVSQIVFRRGTFTPDYSTQGLGVVMGIYDGGVEVIGNIYENPNLTDTVGTDA